MQTITYISYQHLMNIKINKQAYARKHSLGPSLKHQQYPGKEAVFPQANIHIPASFLNRIQPVHYIKCGMNDIYIYIPLLLCVI